MSSSGLPPLPPSLKPIQHYLKTALEHDNRDVVISYWCRLYAMQAGLKLDKSSPEAKKILLYLMDWLEKKKSEEKDNDSIVHDIPAQAYIDNYATKLFLWADSQDRASVFDKNVVKTFYTAGLLYDVLETFGELTEEVQKNKKYAKWKAAYIHNCLRNGDTPMPGPLASEDDGNASEHTIGFVVPPTDNIPSEPKIQDSPPVVPYTPPQPIVVADIPPELPTATVSGTSITPDQMIKAQKYCKFASSALSYDDVPTAVSNLQKALTLLTTGVDPL